MKTHKRKKSSRMHGRHMGTHGWGARKQHRSSGNRGGKGMSGTGKRADQKKTLVLNLYGNKYFGKQGVTSRKTQIKKEDKMNIGEIEANLHNYLKKGVAKKIHDHFEINLDGYKILGKGEVKSKIIIKAKSASLSAAEKIKKAGGNIILKNEKEDIQ